MRTFNFNGVSSRDLLLVNKVNRSIMPPLSIQKQTIPRRIGSIPFYTALEERVITIDVTILGNTETEIRDNVRALASWLYTEEDKALYFNDEPNRVYNARLEGSTDLDQLANIGEGSLTFICHDPLAYKIFEQSRVMDSFEEDFFNDGTFKVYPIVRFVPFTTIDYFRIRKVNTGEQVIISGGPYSAWVPYRIDMNKNRVYNENTGENFNSNIHIESDFFYLDPEVDTTLDYMARSNDAEVPPEDVGVRIIYKERFL
jgi:predicted phage tail component-like protein